MKFYRSTSIIPRLFIATFFLLSSVSFSQEERTSEFWRNVRFGGGIGLSFANGFFSGTLAPAAIYQFQEAPFSLGVGLNGTYNSQKNVFNSTIIGGSVIGLFDPIPEIQASVEFEQLNVNRRFEDNQFRDENYWYPALFVGIGYMTGNVAFGIRYDLLYDSEKSIYANAYAPFLRVFF